MDLARQKSDLVLLLEHAKRSQAGRRRIQDLASKAAVLETRLAEQYLDGQRAMDAAVSFLSGASCMKDARRGDEARRLLDRALVYAETAELREAVQSERAPLVSRRLPAEVFRRATANIRDNSLLRIPQREAHAAALRHFHHSNEHAIIQLPVGCGKTGTMAILPFGIASGRTLVIAPNLEIRDTLRANFDYSLQGSFYKKAQVLTNGSGPAAAILDADASILDADASDFVITNIQQLSGESDGSWLGQLPPDYFDVILVDEGHHNAAQSWQSVFDHFPASKVVSFTATPLRSDGQQVAGRRIYHFPIGTAIREGYVRDLASRRLEPQEIFFEFNGSQHRHSLAEVLELREEAWFSKGVALSRACNESIVNASIQCMRELREGSAVRHQIIAAACSIDHAKSIRSLYTERGVETEVIHSQLPTDELQQIRSRLANQQLDAIVQVQMLGEGADYPHIAVAAVFRPFRHLVPYVQFIGRAMRVVRQNAPGHPDNRGYVVSHVGLNVERWWEELKRFDAGEQLFFQQLADATREFEVSTPDRTGPRRYQQPMEVLEEVVERFVEVGFLQVERDAIVSDVVHALALRGIDLATLGINREELGQRLERERQSQRVGTLLPTPVQPQRRRQEARRRLNERVRSAATEVLKATGLSLPGVDLPLLFPSTGSKNNVGAANVLLNLEIQKFLRTASAERDLLSTEELESAFRETDTFVANVISSIRERTKYRG